jgi:adenylate kinase
MWYSEEMRLAGATIVFIGRPGSGKGTQVALLQEWLWAQGVATARVAVGDAGRRIAEKQTPIGAWVRGIVAAGDPFPDWLAGALMVDALERGLATDDTALILDGSPRRMYEAHLLDDCMAQLRRAPPVAVVLDISEQESRARLMARRRADDTERAIERRLAWFNTHVEPVIAYYAARAHAIAGTGAPREIHENIRRILAGDDPH